jgi:hypothetical protein
MTSLASRFDPEKGRESVGWTRVAGVRYRARISRARVSTAWIDVAMSQRQMLLTSAQIALFHAETSTEDLCEPQFRVIAGAFEISTRFRAFVVDMILAKALV